MEKLMLSKKQLSDLWDEMEKTDPMQTEMSWDDRLQIALLDHLKGLGIVYVKKDLGILGRGHNYTFIPPSDYK